MTKARVCKVAGQEGSLGVMPHVPESVRKCEGMNLHSSKGAFILGVRVSVDSWTFRKWLQGQNLMDWEVPYNIGKLFELKCLK